jgi:phosphomannomutase/molybdopterin-guanine dinucleotide biosynthesis protein A
MSKSDLQSKLELKAVVLAGGKEEGQGNSPMVLQKLGERTILDYVMANARQVVPDNDLYMVVGDWLEPRRAQIGNGCQFIVQSKPLGTGHAVQQLLPTLKNYKGNLLILYGDTPLFRPASIRGLLNRHALRQADLTLLTAIVDRPFPYGRIIRDSGGRIVDIIEETDASPAVRQIHEYNVGAYLVSAPVIFAALEKLPAAHNGEYQLTDCVHHLIRSGLRVESYQICDSDEIQGINTKQDLEQAEFILQKRLFRPRREEEQNQVAFGTGGWRAVIGEGFTLHNVRRLSQALANEITRQGQEKSGVLIGYDRRFLSNRAGEAAAEVFAGNNIPATLLSEDVPTPLVTYATAMQKAYYGLMFTASHNPPDWNGLKVFRQDGSLLLDDETKLIQEETNRLTLEEVIKIDLDLALGSGLVKRCDYTNEYVDAVEALIDLDAIRKASLKVIVDPMYGVGQLTMGTVLTEARCRVTFIHERHNPLFGGRSPAPNLEALRLLATHVVEDHYDLGLATDGDADRIAIVDERGEYITINDILLLLYWYMHEVRGERGGVVRNLATTHLLDRLAKHFGEKCIEVPVGFKHVASAMVTHNAVLGGESSGGLTIRGHILGKDGIFASALVVEMLARTRQKISQLRQRVYEITGKLYSLEEGIPSTPEMRVAVPKRLSQTPPSHIGPFKIDRISNVDGSKIYFGNDNWALVRFSGTEPILRLFVEADTQEKASEMIRHLKDYVTGR